MSETGEGGEMRAAVPREQARAREKGRVQKTTTSASSGLATASAHGELPEHKKCGRGMYDDVLQVGRGYS